MELAHLKALVAVEELGSLRRAGEQLHLSAPAVFEQLKQLEEHSRQKLYERAGRRLVLTEAGTLLHSYARRILREHDEALVALSELSGVRRGLLRFGCGPHISVAIVPHLLRTFLTKYPGVEVRMVTGNDHSLFHDLRSGKVDILLMNLPTKDEALEEVALWRYEMVFIAAPNHPATGRAADLAKQPFILYQRAMIIEEAIQRFCVQAGFHPRIVMQIDQADAIKELVKLGLGVSILAPWVAEKELEEGSLRSFPLGKRKLKRRWGILLRNSVRLSLAQETFIGLCKSVTENLRAG